MTDIKINTPVGGASYKGNAPFKDSIKFGSADFPGWQAFF